MPWPLVKLIPQKTHFKFVRFAFFASFASVALVIASFGSMITAGYRATPMELYNEAGGTPWERIGGVLSHGFNLGIDFTGGTLLEISAPAEGPPIDIERLRPALERLDIGEIQVQGFSDPHNAMVRLPPARAEGQADMQRARAAIEAAVPNVHFGRTEAVGPKVSGELFANGLASLGWAMLLVMVYIWVRFDLQFGVGAVLSLFHDAVLTMGVFSFFRIEFTLPVIAGLLTVIGYSMNDTVVVFDRMRENFRKYKAMKPSDVIDLSINETLSRTLMTIATVLLASFALYLYGGETLRPFAICMLFGVVVATYSSIYIAAPALPIFGDRPGKGPKTGLMARGSQPQEAG
ncbi:protein translocase subunit SecF [Terricaulis sp.]|uniref:protein translocase subunit SecF n=1 Tax=Terricaulis sp. TaxID=2768686 RepID=UPI0037846789